MDRFRPQTRLWFDVGRGELVPTVLYTEEPHVVVWSSIWKDYPDLQIRFDIKPSDQGSTVAWSLLGPTHKLSSDERKRVGDRLEQLIKQLRFVFHA